jgi:hypothetical protein
MLSRGLLLTAVLAGLLLPSSSARAGTIDVYSCRLADGTAVPASGWTPFSNFTLTGLPNPAGGDCGTQYGLLNAVAPTQPGHEAGWRFDAPAGTTIAAVVLQHWASGYANGSTSKLAYDAAFDQWPPPAAGDPEGETCGAIVGSAVCEFGHDDVMTRVPIPDFTRTGMRHARLFLGLRCVSAQTCTPPPNEPFWPGPGLTIYNARITLEDLAAPRIERAPAVAADGSRVDAAVTDPGLGLALVELLVDGNRVAADDLRSRTASCKPPYVDVVPCPSSHEAAFGLDTSALADGVHELRVRAVDLAGNASVSAPAALQTRGGRLLVAETPPVAVPPTPPAPGSTLSAWFAGRSRALVATVDYRRRGRIEGTLTGTGGAPLAAASVQIDDGDTKAETRTDAKGRFAYRALPGPSRTITASYAGTLITRLTLRVRAGVTLTTSTKHVRNGTTLRFTGRLLGQHTRGALVTIYALGDRARRRTTVATVRARAKGRFSYTYTFKSLQTRKTFRFEAQAVKQSGLPYETGTSPRVTVRGRP